MANFAKIIYDIKRQKLKAEEDQNFDLSGIMYNEVVDIIENLKTNLSPTSTTEGEATLLLIPSKRTIINLKGTYDTYKNL
jgi:hypothetical protein